MRLPNADSAEVDVRKLSDYCLNPDHPRGKHKARRFSTALGLGAANAAELRDQILAEVRTTSAVEGLEDHYGKRFSVDVRVRHGERTALVRTGWIIRAGEDFPRLTSCFVKGDS